MQFLIQELKDFIVGNLVIDCVNMQLKSNGTDTVVYSGPGTVTQTDEGGLRLKLHSLETISLEELPENVRTSYKDGEIVPDEAFFTLEARGIDGKLWMANNVLPNASAGPEGTVLSAELRQISTRQEIGQTFRKPAMLLGFPRNVRFPSNVDTRTVKTVDEQMYHFQRDWNMARFTACSFDFELENRDRSWFLAKAQSLEPRDSLGSLDLRISAALQFVLSRRLVWSLCETREGDTIRGHLRPFYRPPESDLPKPPIAFDPFDRSKLVWILFEEYLAHVIDYAREHHYYPLSALVSNVISVSASALENYALVVSIAIEGILNTEFSDVCTLEDNERDELSRQIQIVKEMIQENPELPEGLEDRVRSLLQSILPNPSAKDKLYHFVKEGLLEERLVKAWKGVRHRAAHGHLFSDSEYGSPNRITRLFNWCNEVYQLFNQLVFLAIGYDGPYTDYSTVERPMKSGNTKSVSASEN